ncbi:hypothetical protein BROUX41_000487 [Berkeleyomyces rouxiae]
MYVIDQPSQIKASTFVGQTNPDPESSSRPGADVGRQSSRPTTNNRPFLSPYRPAGTSYQQTGGNTGNSRFGPLAFSTRLAQQQEAPLFHSHYNEFQEEDDDDDDQGRDAADLYALQRSRRVAAASKLAESMGSEGDASNISLDQSRGAQSSFADDHEANDYHDSNEPDEQTPVFQSSFRRGLKSSWHGSRHNTLQPRQTKQHGIINEEGEHITSDTEALSAKGGMVNVGLDSELINDDDPPASLMGHDFDNSPAPFQRFNDTDGREANVHTSFRQQPVFGESEIEESRIQDVVILSSPAESELFKHDQFFAWLYLIMVASPQTPTATLTPRVFNTPTDGPRHSGLVPYRLSKMLLHASRFIMAIVMGFAGWVVTSRQLAIEKPDGTGVVRGSLYAYTVGLVASFIGYSVMGSMESILGNIVDAVVVCYGSERRMQNGVGAYCMEAAYLFGGRRRAEEEGYP